MPMRSPRRKTLIWTTRARRRLMLLCCDLDHVAEHEDDEALRRAGCADPHDLQSQNTVVGTAVRSQSTGFSIRCRHCLGFAGHAAGVGERSGRDIAEEKRAHSHPCRAILSGNRRRKRLCAAGPGRTGGGAAHRPGGAQSGRRRRYCSCSARRRRFIASAPSKFPEMRSDRQKSIRRVIVTQA